MKPDKGFFAWYMTDACNFNCIYCDIKKGDTVKQTLPADRIIGSLRRTGVEWTVGLTGGEPLLYPGFIKLCIALTESFDISLDTNLSLSSQVKEFSDAVDPSRVSYIYASAHVLEREKRSDTESFIQDVLLLRESGFSVIVNYVLHPLVFSRFQTDYDFFKSRGINLEPKAFKGEYGGKEYAQGYGKRERELFFRYNPLACKTARFRSKGLRCNAGRTFAMLQMDGTVTRCTADKTVMGDIFHEIRLNEAAEPCIVDTCPCNGQKLIAAPQKLEMDKRVLF